MKKLNLSKLNLEVLTDQEMLQTKAGASRTNTSSCSCGCRYANKGGSSTSANQNANKAKASTTTKDTPSSRRNDTLGDMVFVELPY